MPCTLLLLLETTHFKHHIVATQGICLTIKHISKTCCCCLLVFPFSFWIVTSWIILVKSISSLTVIILCCCSSKMMIFEISPPLPCDDNSFDEDLFQSLPDQIQLINFTNANLLLIVFYIVLGMNFATNYFNQVMTLLMDSLLWSVFNVCSDVRKTPSSCVIFQYLGKRTVLKSSCISSRSMSLFTIDFSVQPLFFLREPLGLNFSKLCFKRRQLLWAETGAIYSLACFPTSSLPPSKNSEGGIRDNSELMSSDSGSSTWEFNGRSRGSSVDLLVCLFHHRPTGKGMSIKEPVLYP